MVGRRAFLLAGGASRRFGANKARHPIDGLPMALHVARALADVLGEVTLVAPDEALRDLGLPLLLEPAEGPRHPLRGVVASDRLLAHGQPSCGRDSRPDRRAWARDSNARTAPSVGSPISAQISSVLSSR